MRQGSGRWSPNAMRAKYLLAQDSTKDNELPPHKTKMSELVSSHPRHKSRGGQLGRSWGRQAILEEMAEGHGPQMDSYPLGSWSFREWARRSSAVPHMPCIGFRPHLSPWHPVTKQRESEMANFMS